MSKEMKFSILVSLFEKVSKAKPPDKRTKFLKFLEIFCKPSDYFPSIRLILPTLDRERASYHLKESVLATSLIDALGVSRDSEDAKKLINWRKGGTKVAGKYAGNFSYIVAEFLMRRQSSVSGDLTVRELNELLDRLANAGRGAKSDILGEMIRRTNWQEMKWIVMIILKELKIGLSEKIVFDVFHPDAEDLFNVTCDLRLVCEKLSDRNVRHKRQDIQVGKAVIPQKADRALDCRDALKKLHGKEVVVECKFDGFRIQIHKDGGKINYFSPNYHDHDEYAPAMSNVIVDNVLVDKCILDGEMLVWDNSINRFDVFGTIKEISKGVKEGVDSEKSLCFVAFDVLYVGDTSVIHQTLKERHELLRKVVRPVNGRLVILLPNDSSSSSKDNSQRAGERCWSIVANHVDDAERFFKETVENRDEGVIIKDLGSKWEPGDTSRSWLKVKPDYGNAGADLDVLIIGGYYGSGRRGGEIGQFLVGLAEKSSSGSYPRRFVSFCRVGTGLTDEELDELVTKLKPYFRKYEYPTKSPPSFYKVTNHAKERPDVWVESPEKSVIVSITSDIRTISSEVFAAPYCLRFPRIDRVRYDKPWHDCFDVQSFLELVVMSNGTTKRRGGADNNEGLPKRARTLKNGGGNKRLNLTVPSHFTQTDVSKVKGESQLFSGIVFHFVNVPSEHSLDSLHKLVVENGGTFSMNLNNTVTHCVGAESRGIKYEAVKRRGCDVIHYSWVFDCCSQKQLLTLMPKHYVFLSDSTRKKLQEQIDEYSDSYFCDLSVVELKQIFCNVIRSEDAKMVDHYKKKYCPREKWGVFRGCCIYFHPFAKSNSASWDIFLKIATRRMKVEVSLGGGEVCDNPSQATHIVVVSVPGHELKFETLLQSFPANQQSILRRRRLNVVGSQWLEDCLKKEQKLPEVAYNLKPTTFEESASDEEKGGNDDGYEEKPRKSVSKTVPRITEPKRKRGRAVGASTRKSKTIVSKPPSTKRARVGSRPAKLHEISLEDDFSEHETDEMATGISFDDKHNEQDILGKSGLETGNFGLCSKHGLSEKNKEIKEEIKTDELAKANHITQKNVFDDKSGLEKNEENVEEQKPDFNEKRKHCFQNSGFVTCSKPDKDRDYSSTTGKLDVMVDSVHGLLLDLIPGLATNVASENKGLPSTQTQDGSFVEPATGEPVKKKKVSYRELAKQLLKD
ncbi:hypothetical protein SOVF_030970 [Spinacia oleracea]|nr:hypothetical protein SOVF_030970 [Spinacia oleracea]